MARIKQFSAVDRYICFPLALLTLFLASCQTHIGGSIADSNGPIAQAKDGYVNLYSAQNNKEIYFTQPISPTGQFEFSQDIPEDQYILEVLIPGYKIFSTSIDLTKKRNFHIVLNKDLSIKEDINDYSRNKAVHSQLGASYLSPMTY